MRIIVAGGGASGLMAALAAKQSGAEEVLILERGGEIGKKILSTGSGRCNLTNENQSPDCYHSSLRECFLPVLSQFSKEDTIRFFEENGLHLKAKNGYYYPRNAQALSVRDFLRDCCRKAGVCVELNKKITGVTAGAGNRRNRDTGDMDVAGNRRSRDTGVMDAAGNQKSRDAGVTAGAGNRRSKGTGITAVSGNYREVYDELPKTDYRSGSQKEKSGITRFRVSCEDGSCYVCDRLILAGGGKAAPQTGSDGSMLALAGKLGHRIIAPVPALTPLYVKKEELMFFKTAGGTRADARISLVFEEEKSKARYDVKNEIPKVHGNSRNMGEEISPGERIPAALETVTDCGEIQFVDYGLSGIPAFNVSAAAGRVLCGGQCSEKCEETKSTEKAVCEEPAGKRARTNRKADPQARSRGSRVWAEVDFLPEITQELLRAQFDSYRERFPEDTFRMWLRGYLPTKLSEALLALVGIPSALYLRKCTDGEAEKLLHALKGSRFALEGTGTFEKAQTTSGGIDMREVNLETLESRLVPGLYFAGEILDVDGICGGYNLQWAWSSGTVAGRAAAGKAPELGSKMAAFSRPLALSQKNRG